MKQLNNKSLREGEYVLYWMQAAQRAEYNHALEYAIQKANEFQKPLLTFFGLTEHFPEANARHYLFLLEGLQETQKKLAQRGIKMVVYLDDPVEGISNLSQRAILLVTDRGYLRIQREWREKAAQQVNCPFWQVETEVIVPVEVVSSHEEYGAYTIRPKLKKQLNHYLMPLRENVPHVSSLSLPPFSRQLDLTEPQKILERLQIDRSVSLLPNQGGSERARAKLRKFITQHLSRYATCRSDPSQDALSGMSPYLHFGQISPLFVAQEIIHTPVPEESKEAYLEELIVRRELSMNFVFYNSNYDSFEGLPAWAKETLRKHRNDSRKYSYRLEEFENAETHDALWNAAQKELVHTGKMHGYVRMYWGKKVLEWSRDPEEAFQTLLYLNNKYALDGRDPNSFAGIAWCFGKHDRAFGERPIFGKVRYMGKGNLYKKSIEQAYIERIERM
ncbi:MAG: deoxyribodipyrimidine photo-lyase [Atribacterota bacterium]|nr:deoxyribodipyrimidine photo-lyase [Atribacterota bacterium]